MLSKPKSTLTVAALVVAGTASAAWQMHPASLEQSPPANANLPQVSGAGLRRTAFPGPVDAQVTRIVDGDTFEARIRIWFGQEITTLVRLRGIDAPEIKGACPSEIADAHSAATALAEYLSTGPVQLTHIALDKYGGRVVADAMVADAASPAVPHENVASLMLASGLARPYHNGSRGSWCNLAVKAN